MNRNLRILALIGATLLGAASGVQAQQTIDQSKALAGNVAPGDDPGFPITLSRPGHYKLMSNLTVPAETIGVVIAADGVTLDFNGFTMAGQAACTRNASTRVVTCQGGSPFVRGVTDTNAVAHTVIRNGTVRGFGGGLVLNGSATVHDMHFSHNVAAGVTLHAGRMDRVTATMNGGAGINLVQGTIANSMSSQNGNAGVFGGAAGGSSGLLLVVDTVVGGNRSLGIDTATVRGTLQADNGETNRTKVRSLGGNADASGVY